MKVINPGDRVYLPCIDSYADSGETVDVPDSDGASLVAQGWKQHKAAPAVKKAAPAANEPATAEQED